MRGKAWTKEEDAKLLREYKEKGAIQLQKELEGRTLAAIRNRHSYLTKKLKKKKIDKCPICKSNRINRVNTWYDGVVEAYYCVNCLREFLPNGKLIPPLYTDDCEGW